MIILRRADMTDKDIARFWAKVDKSGGCWTWTGAAIPNKVGNKYGHIKFADNMVYAHRFVYALAHGECPTNLVIDHICHNTLCVNPNHLQAVTQQQNNENRIPNKSNKTGIRGVSWQKVHHKYQVFVRSNGKLHYGGEYDDIHAAEKAAVELRNKLMKNNLLDRAK